MSEPLAVERTIERELASLIRGLEAVRTAPGAGGAAMDRAAYVLLDRLSERPRSVGDLATELHLDHSTVTRQVAALIDRRFARRAPDPGGGRAAVLELTASGRRRLVSERSSRARRVNRLLAAWSDEDRDELARLLGKLNTSLDERLRAMARGAS